MVDLEQHISLIVFRWSFSLVVIELVLQAMILGINIVFRFVNEAEAKIGRSQEIENPKDLATCNRLLLDQQRLEDQLDNRKSELKNIQKEADNAMQPRIERISDRLDNLVEPLADRRNRIQTAKEFHQLKRDLQDQIIWTDERLPRAKSDDLGSSLHQVQKLLKRNQNLLLEVDAADARISGLQKQVEILSHKAETTQEQSEQIKNLEATMIEKWEELKVTITHISPR